MNIFIANKTWRMFERIKEELRSTGCIGLASEIYKRQLLLESELLKKWMSNNTMSQEQGSCDS